MYWKTRFLLQFVIYAAALLCSCSSKNIYRDVYEPCTISPNNPCTQNSLQIYKPSAENEFMLGFVEIDDQGQLRDRKQMESLLGHLYEKSSEESILLTVFVHGWHHDARPGDSNIESFKDHLAKTSVIENQRSKDLGRSRRKIVGIYVGWRGESIEIPPFNYLTFWDRKNTAQEVGYLGVTELLSKLEDIVKIQNSNRFDSSKSRLVVIGHSFGGAVVYSATSQILASRFIGDPKKKETFIDNAEGYGDLVVLLNPAFEALRYFPFYDLVGSRCSYFNNQLPRLAILTSEADYATGILFPLGRVFSTIFETHHNIERNKCKNPLEIDEGEADRNTVGHYLPLISHTLKPLTDEKDLKLASFENMKNIWSSQLSGSATQYGSLVLKHLNKTNPQNPYLNIRVDKAIIPDHNNVLNDKVMDFIRLLVALATEDESY
jgi:hypothetical protein